MIAKKLKELAAFDEDELSSEYSDADSDGGKEADPLETGADGEDTILPPSKSTSTIKGRFLEPHPDRKSHSVCLKADNNTRVPMFSGGPLPRNDRGDRDDYCMTMLTLFKLWRTGLDLKEAGISWDETFRQHDFSEYANQKMKFFNTKYECLDAKDDYRTQHKAENQGVNFDWMEGSGGGYGSTHPFDDGDLPENTPEMEQFLANDVSKTGCELCHERDVIAIKLLMMQSGWMYSCSGGLPAVDSIPVGPADNTASKWQSIVKAKRNEVIAAKRRVLPLGESVDQPMAPPQYNMVQIIDEEWFTRAFRAADFEVEDMIDLLVCVNGLLAKTLIDCKCI